MRIHFFSKPFIVLLIILYASCEGGRGPASPDSTNTTQPSGITNKTPLDATVKIYFENTLSMDGYINGNTDFKDVFRELLVAVDNEDIIDLETEFYLINDKLTKTDFGVESTRISEELNKENVIGANLNHNRGSSNFEEVLDIILENQKGDVISVIMADFIYSPKQEPDVPSALNKLRTYTQEAFLKAGKQNPDLETRIYSFSSDFKDLYYDIDNKGISGIKTRPYYYFVIAPANLMEVFANNIAPQLKKTSGFKNEALFTSANFSTIPIEILTATANNGRIKARDQKIEVVDYPRNGNLEFTVLADLSKLPVNSEYLLNKNNFTLTNPEFSIKDIGVVKGKNIKFNELGTIKMDPSTLVGINNKKFTHAILFSAEGMVSEDLKFALNKRIPSWVNRANSDDDRQISNDSLEKTKTFGFGPLVQGVARAYNQQSYNDEYFNITIPIK